MAMIKLSETNTDMEQRLHELVMPQIRSRLPKLMPTMVGFELLDCDDDELNATGIYAFRVGQQMVYIPVFYKEGQVKGLNLLYLANDDLFLPAEEEWVEYIVNRQPFTTGRLVNRSELRQDSLNNFRNVADSFGRSGSYQGKIAGELGAKLAANVFASDFYKSAAARCDLAVLLTRFPKSATLQLLNTMSTNDDFGRAVLQFYPYEKLAVITDKIIKTKRTAALSANPIGLGIQPEDKPIILTSDDNSLAGQDLTDEEREEIRRDGVAVHDPKKVTEVYRTEAPMDWFSPSEQGCYKILTPTGKVVEAAIFSNIVTVGDGEASCLVVVADDEKCGVVSHDALTAVEQLAPVAWDKQYKKLPKITSPSLKEGDKFILVNSHMKATPMLTLVGTPSRDAKSGMTTLWVEQSDYVQKPRQNRYEPCCPIGSGFGSRVVARKDRIEMRQGSERTPFVRSYVQEEIDKGKKKQSELEPYDYKSGRRILVLENGDEDNFQIAGNQLMVGPDVRVMKVKDAGDELIAPMDLSLWPYIKSASKDIQKMTITSRGDDYEISCGLIKSGAVNYKDALIHLCRVHGVAKAAAKDMLAAVNASETGNKPYPSFAVKYAQSFPDLDTGPGGGNPYGIQESTSPVDIDKGDGNPFLTRDINSTIQSARSGDKESFDASVMTALLRRHDVGSAVDEMLPDLTTGLDRMCRVLFLVYAHKDALGEIYGTEELPQLTDALENQIKETGSVLMTLKKKSIENESHLDDGNGLLTAPRD